LAETWIAPWIEELKRSFSAYPDFVERVSTALPAIERQLSDLGIENAALEARLAVLEAASKQPDSPGMAPEARQEMNALLERFERELESTRAAADSATRELTTLKRELQSRDAEIERLRAAPPVSSAPQKTVARVRKELSEKRVLLIDDAEVNRVLLSHYLKGLPVRMDYATTVSKAIELCSRAKYDLLILDTGLIVPGDDSALTDLNSSKGEALLVAFTERESDSTDLAGFSSVISRALPRESLIERLSKNLWS
jgi:CheY-like chemotaxis protein